VCAGGSLTHGDILDLLTHLVDKSLVAVSPGSEHRYRLLETVRQYARGKLVRTADAEAVFRAHRDWHLDLVQRAEPHLRGREQRSWLERLDREYADLRAAFEWSLAAGENHAAEKMAVALVQFFFRRGHSRDGVAWLERLIEAEEATGRTALRARLTHGWLTSRGAATAGPDAEPRFHETVEIAREHGDARAVALARASLGTFLHGSAPERSEEILSQALGELRRLDGGDGEDAFVQAVALLHLGNISRTQGRYAEARQRYEQTEVLADGIGDLLGVAWARTMQGIVDRYLGQLDRAIELHAQAAQTSDEVGDRFGSAFSRSCTGIVELVRGDLTAAQAAFEESLATVRALGATFTIVEDLMFLALTAHLAGDDADARRRLIEGFDRNRGHQRSTTTGLIEITASLLASTEPVEAVRLFAAAAITSRPPYWTAFFEPTLVQLRESLGPDHFAEAWADGRGYSREEAVEIARGHLIEDGHA
jgi:ATP/maltotriose-dependent transcriptional regulator MalT